MQVKYILFLLLFFSTLTSAAQTDEAGELLKSAVRLKKEGKCSNAVELLKKAIAVKPGYGAALYELGWCYNELQRYEEALTVLQQARQTEHSNHKVIYEIGFAKMKLGKHEEALADFNQVLNFNPSFVKAYSARANLYKDVQKNSAAALADYLKASALDTTAVNHYYWIGWCYNDLGRFSEALPYLQKAIELDNRNELYYTEIGFSCFSLERYDEALLHLQKADALKPDLETTLYYLGMCYVKQNKKADALKKYNELNAMKSTYATGLLNEIKLMK